MIEGLGSLEDKMDSVDAKVDSVDSKLSTISSKIDAEQQQVDSKLEALLRRQSRATKERNELRDHERIYRLMTLEQHEQALLFEKTEAGLLGKGGSAVVYKGQLAVSDQRVEVLH